MPPSLSVVAATRNRAKVLQLSRLVGDLANVVPLPTEAGDEEVPEDGATLIANAEIKATFWSSRLQPDRLVIATDGGLVIQELGDRWDPVRTRRFAGAAVTDRDRANALLRLAADLHSDERRIYWQEAMAVARGGVLLAVWSAMDGPGLLADDVDAAAIASGNGFWVPAIWRSPDHGGRRLTELCPDELAGRQDHWQELGTKLRDFLRDYDRSRSR